MPGNPPDDLSKPETAAEALLAEYFARVEAGDALEFDAWCAKHPEHADELRRLHTEWHDADRALDSSLEWGVEFDNSEESASSASSDAVLDRLREHRSQGDRYRLKGEIARGGMGAILRVWDEDLRRHLAMKVILGKGKAPSTGDTPAVRPEDLSRFLEEAQVTGQLDHPGIVPVHELGLDATGRVYFTMKLVKGRDFEQVIKDVHAGKEGWNLTRAVGVLLKACEGIAFAHSKQVIHRDLKPANLMVGKFGEVYVMDWGLARVLGEEDTKDLRIREDEPETMEFVATDRREEADSPLLTVDGDVVGTPAYMSPEQAHGDLERVGPASDVYSMGAVLYHLLANRRPYAEAGERVDNRATLRRVHGGPPHPLHELASDLPGELVSICEKAMRREPEDRYQDVEELADDIRNYLENRVVQAHRGGVLLSLRKWVRRNRAAALTGAAALVVLAAVGVVSVLRIVHERDRALVAEGEAEAARARIAADWDDLGTLLAGQGSDDPWRVAEELCAQQRFPAALALARGASGPDTARLPEYVERWREWRGDAKELRRLHNELRDCERLAGAEGKLQEALDRLAEISLPEGAPESLVVRHRFVRGYCLWGLNQFPAAVDALEEVAGMAGDLGWRDVEYHALRGAMYCAQGSWRFKASIELCTKLVTLCEQRHRMDLLADAEATLGALHRKTADYEAAVAHLGRSVEIFELLPWLSVPENVQREFDAARNDLERKRAAEEDK